LTCPRVDPTADDNFAFRMASENGLIEVVKLLLTCPGVNPAVEDNYAIRKAATHGHLKIVELLFTLNTLNLTCENNMALRIALETSHHAFVKLLFANHLDTNFSAFQIAASHGYTAIVKFFLTSSNGTNHTFHINCAFRLASANGYI